MALFLGSFFLAQPALAFDRWETISPPGTSGYVFNTVAAMADQVYLGTDHGVYRSNSRGAAWTAFSTGLTNQNVNTIAIGAIFNGSAYEVTDSSPVFAGTAAGFFVTTVDGTSWTASNSGLSNTNIKDIEIDQFQATQGSFTTVYVATPSGVFRSDDAGSTWVLKNNGMSGKSVIKLESDFGNAKIYALTATNELYASDLFSSSGNDESWTQISTGGGTTMKDVSLLNPAGYTNWVATTGGIQKSDTNGTGWTNKNGGLAAGTINTVASDYLESNIAYAAHATGGVYRTVNEAEGTPQWSAINMNLAELTIKEVTTNPGTSNLVYAVGASGAYGLILSDPYVALDTTAPTVAQVTAVTSPTRDTTPDYIFSSTESGTVAYGGSCTSATTSATSGNTTVTFTALAVGIYSNCTVTVTDASGNASTPLAVASFVITYASDLNVDRAVNVLDYGILKTNYGTSNAAGDVNFDGSVNVLDYGVLHGQYGQSV